MARLVIQDLKGIRLAVIAAAAHGFDWTWIKQCIDMPDTYTLEFAELEPFMLEQGVTIGPANTFVPSNWVAYTLDRENFQYGDTIMEALQKCLIYHKTQQSEVEVPDWLLEYK